MAAAAAVAAGVAALTGCSDHGSVSSFYGGAGGIGFPDDAMAEDGSVAVFYGAPNPEDASLVAFYGSASFDAAGLLPDAGTDATRDGSSTDASDSGTANPADAETDAPQDG
jgi:hypothetical protein